MNTEITPPPKEMDVRGDAPSRLQRPGFHLRGGATDAEIAMIAAWRAQGYRPDWPEWTGIT
jgi:hypothetical protein